ncbi:kinase-like domain-containing protein [Xylogone sp. PMI_703]|nr:kinase-like domain-containing protein [Xylogone sp. PMI_703]
MSVQVLRSVQSSQVLTSVSRRSYRLIELASPFHPHVWIARSESDGKKVIVKSPLRPLPEKQRKATRQLNTEMTVLNGPLKGAKGIRQLVDQITIYAGPNQELQAGVFEYFDTDLHKYHVTEREHLTRVEIKSIARQLLEALVITHKNNIVHTDLKPGNFVFSRQKSSTLSIRIKIIDFGLASLGNYDRRRLITNPCWRSPESWLGMPWGPAADIWSFGAIIGSLLMEPGAMLFRPWGGLANISAQDLDREFVRTLWTVTPFPETFFAKMPEEWKSIISTFTPKLAPTGAPITLSFIGDVFRMPDRDLNFIKDVLQVDPSERPTAKQLLQHPWFDC